MKNFILLFLALSTFAVSAQRKPKIKGNKTIVDVNEDLPFFNAIELRDDLEVLLKKTAIPGYSVSADDNLIDVLKFEVVDSTLIIRSFYKITAKKQLEITVNYNELNSISLENGKLVSGDMINAEVLNISTYGSSKLELNARASIMNITMEGNSTGDFNLQTDSLDLKLRDKTDLNLYGIISKGTIEMYDNTHTVAEGTADTLNIKLFGSSNLKAENLEAGVVHAVVEETTKARIHAYKTIELSSSGSAKTYLWGNAKLTINEFLNTSELYKREE